MSLKSWKEEFYPTEARDFETWKPGDPGDTPSEHSLRKWIGLRVENLAKHGLQKPNRHWSITDGDLNSFTVDGHSCALCANHMDDEDDEDYDEDYTCDDCPLYEAQDGHSCDDIDGPEGSIFHSFIYHNDPEPMIAALKIAVKIERPTESKKKPTSIKQILGHDE